MDSMDTNISKIFAVLSLLLTLTVSLCACNSTKIPETVPQTVWEDPTPEIHGTIETGIYKNTWLNLKKTTTTDVSFLEEYNRVSCMSDPESSRWCELYEYDEDGNSLILTVEKIPQNATAENLIQSRCETFQKKFSDTKDDIKISLELKETDTSYKFREYSGVVYRFYITTQNQGVTVEGKNASLLFWEKDGYLAQLQYINTDIVQLDSLFLDVSDPNSEQNTAIDLAEIMDFSKVWKIDCVFNEGYTLTLHFVFCEDGTLYEVQSYQNSPNYGEICSYKLRWRKLTFYFDQYFCEYVIDPKTLTLTQQSLGTPFFYDLKYANLQLEIDDTYSAEEIKEIAQYYEDNYIWVDTGAGESEFVPKS